MKKYFFVKFKGSVLNFLAYVNREITLKIVKQKESDNDKNDNFHYWNLPDLS